MFPILQSKVLDIQGPEYKPLPEIYQIELTNACQLQCPMCVRTTHMKRPTELLDMKLLDMMLRRGDFEGSSFVELQMWGEPFIHPQAGEIIRFLHHNVGVLVGASTNGLLLRRDDACRAALQLDAITISVDAVNEEVYHQMRHPAHFVDLLAALDNFMHYVRNAKAFRTHYPFVELQLVKTDLVSGSGNIEALAALCEARGWTDLVNIRTNNDTQAEMQGRRETGVSARPLNQVCLNPFTSVSVMQDGTVVSCCYIYDTSNTANVYGNLYQHSLADIWASSNVSLLRKQFAHAVALSRLDCLHGTQCEKCYYWSPVHVHSNIIRQLIRSRR